ncbi:MAG: nitrilase-related carbon-nitrogen hydrolase [Polyangiales bacterium]
MTTTTFGASTSVSNDTRPLADRLPLAGWAALAFAFTFLAGHRWGIAALVWVAPVPWLVLATRLRGKRAWAGLFVLSLVAHVAWMSKVVTAPMPWFLGIAFGVPVAIGTFVGLGLYRVVRDRGGALAALSFYLAFVVASDLIGARTSELGAWSTSANALVADVTLMQLVSLGGLSSIGLLIAAVSGTLAMAVTSRRPSRVLPLAVLVGACLVAAYGFGAWRLDAGRPEARSVRVAAVTTSVGLGEAGLPDDATLGAAVDELFARSEAAVEAGAELVVWNEAAAMLRAPSEAPTIARGRAFAREHGVELVLGYAVLVNEAPFSFRNEYVWIDRDGELVETYAKHHPVPGEPSIRGEAPLVVHEHPWGRGAGALCYDYDFPAMALEHARLGADLVVVPSSDWRGIDPYHTEMARVRALEGGFSVVRPVRWAASAAFDSLGRVRGWMPADDPSGVMVVSVPTERVPTLYSKVGDAPMASVAGGFSLLSLLGIGRRRAKRGRPSA